MVRRSNHNRLTKYEEGYAFFSSLLDQVPSCTLPFDAYLEMLEGTGLPWAVAVIGGDVVACGMGRLALDRGGHVRVGLEDYAGPRTPTNAELVAEVVALARAAGRSIATPPDASRVLGLPDRFGRG